MFPYKTQFTIVVAGIVIGQSLVSWHPNIHMEPDKPAEIIQISQIYYNAIAVIAPTFISGDRIL